MPNNLYAIEIRRCDVGVIFALGIESGFLEDFRQLSLIAGGKKKVLRTSGQDKGHRLEMDAWVAASPLVEVIFDLADRDQERV